MYVRVLNFSGVKDLDGGITFLREKALPVVRQQKGFRGITASADRKAGVLGVLSFWETAADRAASFDGLEGLRREAEGVTGGKVSVQNVEEVAVETGSTPPGPGAFVLITAISMDPSKVDENVAFFKSEVAPAIRTGAGFRGLRSMIDRETGQGMVGTVWADRAALDAAAEAAKARRQQADARVTFGEVSVREIVFTELT